MCKKGSRESKKGEKREKNTLDVEMEREKTEGLSSGSEPVRKE